MAIKDDAVTKVFGGCYFIRLCFPFSYLQKNVNESKTSSLLGLQFPFQQNLARVYFLNPYLRLPPLLSNRSKKQIRGTL